MARYWCKPCEIFIDDNNLARKHHDDSQRHKSNIQRSIWKLHQKNRDELRVQRDLERAEREAKIANGEKIPFKKIVKKKKKKEVELEMKEAKEEIVTQSADIGQWEVVQKLEPTTSTEEIESSDKVTKLPPLIPKPFNTKTTVDRETKSWKLTSKTIQLSDSDDEPTPKLFKKRKLKKSAT